MTRSTATLAPPTPTPAPAPQDQDWGGDWLADLDVSVIEGGVAAEQLIRMTDDNCNATCATACVSCNS